MKLSTEIPPVYKKCNETFGVTWDMGVIITYGDTVYSKYPISPDLEVHESTHVRQQTEMGAEKWWDRYFVDKKFRLEQEAEAYQNQAGYIRKTIKDRNRVAKMIHKLCMDMAVYYGGMCTFSEAQKLLSK